MKKLLSTIVIAISISACATHSTNYSVGNEFSSEMISKIIKNKSSKEDLIKLFGQPQFKSVLSENDEKWVYSYTLGTASVEAAFLSSKVNSSGVQKMLDILIRNGIVINYAYTENQLPSYKSNAVQ